MDKELIEIAWKMISKICTSRRCSECPLEKNNHPFPSMKSICLLEKYEHTEETIQYIGESYYKLFPDGELVLPKQINISAEDVLEVFK